MKNGNSNNRDPKVIIRILLCAVILVMGVLGMAALAMMKKPPAEAKPVERALKVEIQKAERENVPVQIRGFGQIRPITVVSVTSEVSGTVTEIHPRLEAGETIPEGELLFKIDTRDYRAAADNAGAGVRQAKQTVARLKMEYDSEKKRLATLRRNRDLAEAEYRRLRKLFEKSRVGSRSIVDSAEQIFNNASDLLTQLTDRVRIYPVQIREAEAGLQAAEAALKTARIRLDRCEVRAPFTARIKTVSLEAGQYAGPGQPVLTLADDAILEIEVPLDSRDVKNWMKFQTPEGTERSAWFGQPEPVVCGVRWTEDPDGHVWKGRLDRVVRFSDETRTVTVAVRLTSDDMAEQAAAADGMPLVEGMFCAVEIPGKIMKDVVRLPRWAVTFDNTVYLNENSRLKTASVRVIRVEDETAYVGGGIPAGAQVIVTRLVDPLENALIETLKPEKDAENTEKTS